MSRPRLHREVMRLLAGDIICNVYAPGDRLPRETDIAEQFGVSRGVARECIRGLEERGLVSVTHGRGATVAPARQWNVLDPDILELLLASGRSASVLKDYLELRRLLEVEAAGLAAVRATADDLARLSDAFVEMAAAAERSELNPAAEDLYLEADIAFRRAVVDAAGNRALASMADPLYRALSATHMGLARPEQRREQSIPQRKRILSAIASRNPHEARAAMRDHLLTIESYFQGREEEVAMKLALDHTREPERVSEST